MPARECFRLRRSLVRVLSRRRAILAFVCLFFLWSTMFSFLWDGPLASAPTQADPGSGVTVGGLGRLDSAKQFVAQLARRQHALVDGPYTSRLTGYDTKKLLALLLDQLLNRLSAAERAAARKLNSSCADLDLEDCGSGSQSINRTKPRNKIITAIDLLLGAQDSCALDPADLAMYPLCDEKVKWMSQFWRSHPCYRRLGVDGSICSFVIYLSEVETFCPRLPSRDAVPTRNESDPVLQPRTDMAPLLNEVLVPHASHHGAFDFIRERVARLWPGWVLSAERRHRATLGQPHRNRLHIHLHLGLLSLSLNWRIAEGSRHGGPLGELVQWSDLIGALYAMGHHLHVTTETAQLDRMAKLNPFLRSPCLVPSHSGLPDLLFTDIAGLAQMRQKFGQGYDRIKCIMRVVDTFGTQPQFNLRSYARRHHILTPWGGRGLHPRQFFNLYPLTPDNSFLGFVVTAPSVLRPSPSPPRRKREMALIYGKKAYMWKIASSTFSSGMRAYLDVVNEFFDIHATVSDPTPNLIPPYVKNHHVVSPKVFQRMLQAARVYIGLGFPYEGPAPLEAIAQGTVFINPRFQPPLSRANSKFFRTKPTARQLSSQHPYVERFIGEPYSYLVDIHDLKGVRATLRRVLDAPRPPPGLIPFELTQEGFIQRMAYYLRSQDFCYEQERSHYGTGLMWKHWGKSLRPDPWPPMSSVKYFLGITGESCETTCDREDRICEPAHFIRLNSVSSLQELSGLVCDHVQYTASHLAPYRRAETSGDAVACIFQSEPLLFSCAGEESTAQRLCPCRDYMNGQSALCQDCDR